MLSTSVIVTNASTNGAWHGDIIFEDGPQAPSEAGGHPADRPAAVRLFQPVFLSHEALGAEPGASWSGLSGCGADRSGRHAHRRLVVARQCATERHGLLPAWQRSEERRVGEDGMLWR